MKKKIFIVTIIGIIGIGTTLPSVARAVNPYDLISIGESVRAVGETIAYIKDVRHGGYYGGYYGSYRYNGYRYNSGYYRHRYYRKGFGYVPGHEGDPNYFRNYAPRYNGYGGYRHYRKGFGYTPGHEGDPNYFHNYAPRW